MTFTKKLAQYISYYEKQNYLNGSLLVADKTGILYHQHFGMANIPFQIKNSQQTKYQIGSLTKGFTAMAIFMLADQNKLNIYNTIDQYLPDFPNGDQITLYHCLTCTSGIPDFVSFDQFWEVTMRLDWQLDEIIDSFKSKQLNFEPGSKFAYATSGYLLLTKIIEHVTKQSYAKWLTENIFTPLGMFNTGCSNNIDIVANLADNYSYWETEIRTPQTDLSFPLGGYGLYATTEDLYIWDQAIRKNKLIPEQLTNLMFTVNQDSYACGWDIGDIMDHRCHQHFGDISGFVSAIKQFEKNDLTIIFLSNLDIIPVTTITKEIAELYFGKPFTAKIEQTIKFEKDTIDNLIGKYALSSNAEPFFEITAENNDLFLIVAKLYGVRYKFKLLAKKTSEEMLKFKTEKINETLFFENKVDNSYQKITYVDYNQHIFTVVKLH